MNVVNMRSEQSERRVAIALLSYAQSLSWSKLHASLLSLSAQHDGVSIASVVNRSAATSNERSEAQHGVRSK
jgi:hypothetical protein